MLIDQGVDVNSFNCGTRYYSSALQRAASMGHIDMAVFLLKKGADVNNPARARPGDLPIEGAAHSGQEEMVELLVDNGADPTKALCSAAGGGQVRVMISLLSRAPFLPQQRWGSTGRKAFLRAYAAGNLTAMAVLVKAGVSLNDSCGWGFAGYHGKTPISFAKEDGLEWVVEHLLSLGAEENAEAIERPRDAARVREVLISQRSWEWVGKY